MILCGCTFCQEWMSLGPSRENYSRLTCYAFHSVSEIRVVNMRQKYEEQNMQRVVQFIMSEPDNL
jgi:hypothetical protein